MRRSILALLLVLGGAAPALAQGQPVALHKRAAEKLARALALVAADKGDAVAATLAGPQLPKGLRAALRAVGKSPRAADLRAMDDTLKAEMLGELLVETPQAQLAVRAFAQDAATHLLRELSSLGARCKTLSRAAEQLKLTVRAQKVRSRKVARRRPEGPTLLLYAAQAPLLRALLARPKRLGDQHAMLARVFDRSPNPLASAYLDLLRRLSSSARGRAALASVDGAQQVRAAMGAARDALGGLRKTLEKTVDLAAGAVRAVRDEELRQVVQGQRSPQYEEVVPLIKAYRRQFKSIPSLRATPLPNVYADTASARVHFWIPGQRRWIRGPARVDKLDPVVRRFLAARDPLLRRQATRPRALAAVYAFFEGYTQEPFSKGYAAYERKVRRVAAAVRRLARVASSHGMGREPFERAMGERAGVAASLFRGGPEASAARLSAHLLRTIVERGSKAGWALVSGIAQADRDMIALRLTPYGVRITGAPADAELELVPRPASLAFRWSAKGARWALRFGTAQDHLSEPHLYAFAGGSTAYVGEARLAVGRAVSLALEQGPPGLVVRHVLGGGWRVTQHPRESVPLELWQVGPDQKGRPLAQAPGGGWLTLTPREPAGEFRVEGRAPQGHVLARTRALLTSRRGVVLGTAARPVWHVALGKTLTARVWEGGKPVSGSQAFTARDAFGQVVARGRGDTFSWSPKVAGRYQIAAEGAQPVFFGAGPAPRVVAARVPYGAATGTLRPGEGFFLRVDAWPAVSDEEVLEVRWRIEGGGKVAQASTQQGVGGIEPGGLLPVRLKPTSRAGKRSVRAELVTARGVLVVSGTFRVEPAGARQVPLSLRTGEGRVGGLSLGEQGRLRVRGELSGARWTLVGPRGLTRPLLPRFDGQVPLEVESQAGTHWVWFHGRTRAGGEVVGTLRVPIHTMASLSLSAPKDPQVGQRITVTARPPAGFKPPFQIRLGRRAWQRGTTLEVPVAASNSFVVTLRDAKGRKARGELSFRGRFRKTHAKGPRFGIVADVRNKRIFATDYAQLQTFKQSDALPKTWVVFEWGPFDAARVRDRIFKTVPYDGAGRGRQVAYRSVRFWEQLQGTTRRRFSSLDVAEGTAYEVLNTPSPHGEQTLHDLVGKLLDKQGGWSFRLQKVRVRADGVEPRQDAVSDPKIVVGLLPKRLNKRGGAVARIEVPGPLAETLLATSLPKTLDLARSHALLFSLSAKRGKLVPKRPYPDGWEKLAPKALLCPELSIEVQVEGKTLATRSRRAVRNLAGVDIGLAFDHERTERAAKLAGKPRQAERHKLRLLPFGDDAAKKEQAVRFGIIPPGRLDNAPRFLVIVVRGRMRRAVPAARWPAGKRKPKQVEVQGRAYRFEARDVPETFIELKITYVREAPGGKAPAAKTGKDLGALRAGGRPSKLSFERSLSQSRKSLRGGRLDRAEWAARVAASIKPHDPRPWALLADVFLKRQRVGDALARAAWASRLGSSVRAEVIRAEALMADGLLDEAGAALKQALKLKPTGALRKRCDELKKFLE